MRRYKLPTSLAFLGWLAITCGPRAELTSEAVEGLLAKYITLDLTADLSHLSDSQRRMLPLLIEAAQAMDEVFWLQAYGDKGALLDGIDDPGLRRFALINYGPWDRLAANEPFLPGVASKPPGANFYPADMTAEEFQNAYPGLPERHTALASLYTMVRRTPEGELIAVPYSEAFAEQYGRAAAKLREAAELAEDTGFQRYLTLRAEALLSDNYLASDLAWMDMKNNLIDIVIGPIETYEDKLFGYKAASEAYVLIKDREWSARLGRYVAMLPELQRGLPVPPEYKSERPGSDSDLNAYDVIYYAGDCNSGAKTIAINLPNDEQVQLEKGTRRLQLKNTMRAKFDRILQPISAVLIDPQQRSHITFEAFFGNTMFHEVAHGLGIKNTIDGSGTVRAALRDRASALEEGKADVLGLTMMP
ncbi:MAG: Zn-dependent hydrolase, partial [Candidatus Marinimicrobia bacterium]|nr:Zn-dependent hydrolase [Candidatus Neomarinimicrobiota bacterium]